MTGPETNPAVPALQADPATVTEAAPRPEALAPASAPLPVAKKKAKLPETTEGMPWHSSHEIKKEPNAFTDGDWRNLLYAWAGMAVRLVIVLGAIFSVYQFLAARSEKRIERTLGMVELWETAPYQDAVTALNRRLATLNAENQGLLPSNPTDTEMQAYMSRIGIQAIAQAPDTDPATPEMTDHFDKVLYFLNRVAFCVEGNLCSTDVADAYFRDYAVSFWGYFSGYVQERRKAGATTLAQPIENYVKNRAGDCAAQ